MTIWHTRLRISLGISLLFLRQHSKGPLKHSDREGDGNRHPFLSGKIQGKRQRAPERAFLPLPHLCRVSSAARHPHDRLQALLQGICCFLP